MDAPIQEVVNLHQIELVGAQELHRALDLLDARFAAAPRRLSPGGTTSSTVTPPRGSTPDQPLLPDGPVPALALRAGFILSYFFGG